MAEPRSPLESAPQERRRPGAFLGPGVGPLRWQGRARRWLLLLMLSVNKRPLGTSRLPARPPRWGRSSKDTRLPGRAQQEEDRTSGSDHTGAEGWEAWEGPSREQHPQQGEKQGKGQRQRTAGRESQSQRRLHTGRSQQASPATQRQPMWGLALDAPLCLILLSMSQTPGMMPAYGTGQR